MAAASFTMFTIGTGKKRPEVVFMLSAAERASALFMKPVMGLK
jgi:hypothetical protein